MARANVYNKNGSVKKNHKVLLMILITASIIIIAGIVLLILWGVGVFNGNKEIPTYFSEYEEYKINTSQIGNKIDDKEMSFIFVYNNDEFDSLSDSDKSSVENQVSNLINAITEKNETYPIDFYIIDASLSVNSSILENSSYGSFTFTPQLLFFYDGTFYANMQSAIDANSGLEGIIDTNSEAIKFNATSVGSFVQITRDTTKMIQNITLS